jgi:hypothetical protein
MEPLTTRLGQKRATLTLPGQVLIDRGIGLAVYNFFLINSSMHSDLFCPMSLDRLR